MDTATPVDKLIGTGRVRYAKLNREGLGVSD
jgi:hypothetical protein